jgi:hypothetical protein
VRGSESAILRSVLVGTHPEGPAASPFMSYDYAALIVNALLPRGSGTARTINCEYIFNGNASELHLFVTQYGSWSGVQVAANRIAESCREAPCN